jgi:CII-binding regulator of phage lambda lysogenization HflD
MKTTREIITAMCITFRHDYGLPKENVRVNGQDVPIGSSGMTDSEREILYNTMSKIYTNAIEPNMVPRVKISLGQSNTTSVADREKLHLKIQLLEEQLAHYDKQLVRVMDLLAALIGKL